MSKSHVMTEQAPRKLAYTLQEAAQAVGVSTPTMAEWVRIDGFPAFRSGKRWVIPVGPLENWLNEQAARGGSVVG